MPCGRGGNKKGGGRGKGRGKGQRADDGGPDDQKHEDDAWGRRINQEDKDNKNFWCASASRPLACSPVPERLVHSATSALPRRRAYYSKLLSLEGDEFERFQHACREPLPSTFRLAGPFRFEIGEAIQKQFLNDMAEPFSVTIEGAETITVPPTQRLTWYPEQLAWQLTAGKRALRKGTELQPLREFLIVHTASGHITRSASRRTRLAATPSPNIGAAGRRLLA